MPLESCDSEHEEHFLGAGMGKAYIPVGPPTTPDQAWSRAVEPRTGEGLDMGPPTHVGQPWSQI